MAIAGAAFGAAKALEDIVAERLLAQKLEQEIADRNARMELEQRRVTEAETQNTFNRDRQTRLDTERADAASAERRGRSNMAGVLSMGLDPDTAKREVAFSSLQSGVDVPDGVMSALTPAKPKTFQYTYTDPKTGSKSIRFANQDEVGPGGVDMGRDPVKAEKAPRAQVFNVGNGKLVDENGRVIYDGGGTPNDVDPAKAREKGTAMLNAARSLRNHPGLSSLTGARIGNPAYALGVSEEPIAGSQAADAMPFFNQFKSLATLDNIGLLKGVLSDSDMKLLAAAGTSLDTKMTDPTFVAELDEVIRKLEAAFGGGQPSLPPMNPVSSRGTVAAPPNRVDELIRKYGGGGA